MKKILSIILTGAMILALSGCGKAKITVNENSEPTNISQSQGEESIKEEIKSAMGYVWKLRGFTYEGREYTF